MDIAKKENPFINLAFNVLLPVLILNKGTEALGSFWALIIALSFPVVYGAYDFYTRDKFNWISVLGFLNVLLTGGFALSGLTGIWFAVKEAVFPLLIGVFVAGSAFTKKPLIQSLLMNPQVMNTDKIEAALSKNGNHQNFYSHLKTSTLFLAGSFLVSAFLNFFLAIRIFTPIDSSLSAEEQSSVLNGQIAQMTSWSFAVILAPSILILMVIMWYLLRGIKTETGLRMEDIIKS